jgi:hypothetical protein
MATDIDALVLERFVLLKREQHTGEPATRDEYLSKFKLD